MLKIKNLSKRFGGLEAVSDFNLEVKEGEIFGIIGPNGAGKSTTLNMIDGSIIPTNGTVLFKGDDISRLRPYKRSEKGIASRTRSSQHAASR